MSSLQKALKKEQTAVVGQNSLQRALEKEKVQGGGGKHYQNPPTVTTAYDDSSSSDEDDDSSVESDQEDQPKKEDLMKIREQAFKVLNTPSSGPQADAQKKKYGQQTFVSPYQKQSAGENSSVQISPPSSNPFSTYQTSNPYAMHDPLAHPPAQSAKELTVTEMLVNCVSEVCKSSSSELVQKVLGASYRSVSNYENPPVSGTWGDIDTSQHGYGNGNKPPTQYNGNANGGKKVFSSYHD